MQAIHPGRITHYRQGTDILPTTKYEPIEAGQFSGHRDTKSGHKCLRELQSFLLSWYTIKLKTWSWQCYWSNTKLTWFNGTVCTMIWSVDMFVPDKEPDKEMDGLLWGCVMRNVPELVGVSCCRTSYACSVPSSSVPSIWLAKVKRENST